jgi:signal transduction histidine kinase/ActR/RegA family two-component response regulator
LSDRIASPFDASRRPGGPAVTALWPAIDFSALTPHGFCLSWQPGLIWLYLGSDSAIALAYLAISCCLAWIIRKRPDLRYRWVAWMFVAFILACGATHAMAGLTLYVPAYLSEGLIKLVTAALSIFTALALLPVVPRLLALPTAAQMAQLNTQLQARIVEQERVTALLRENEARLLLTQEAGGIDSWEWRIEADRSWRRLPGRMRAEPEAAEPVTLDFWLDTIHPADRRRVQHALSATAAGAADFEEEFRVALPEGGWRWLHERGQMLSLACGLEARMLGVSIDVTERRLLLDRLALANAQLVQQAEADNFALQFAAEQHDLLFKNSSDGLFIIRVEPRTDPAALPEFRYEALNPATCRLVGGDDKAGRRPQDCLPPTEAAAWLDALRDCVTSGAPLVLSMSRRTAEGERQFEASLSPAHDPASRAVTHIIGCSRDVTDRVQMEAQLRQMQRMEVTGRLTAGVAHDFNNLLQTLMGGLEMLRHEIADRPNAVDYADLALQAARRGADLTHSLLAFSRQQTLRPRAVPVGTLLSAMQRLAAPMLGPATICTIEIEDDELTVFADGGQLEIALLNLLVNANDAMPQGGSLTLSARRVTPEQHAAEGLAAPTDPTACANGHGVLVVEDSGCGMDEATIAQACEPFFTTKGLGGTGLGLSMVQGFARQSGGDVRIASRPGAGTRVELWLPAGSPAPAPAQPPPPPAAALPQVGARGRVMVVDDVSDVLVTVGAFLRSSGFQTTQVRNSDEALAAITAGAAIDVLVTDYAMPGLNGLDLLLQAREIRPDLPVLVITGFWNLALPTDLKRFMVLRKPFDRSTLVAHILALMETDARHASVLPPL